MIQLERMNGSRLWLNPFHIESVEQTPDTVVTLANGHKYLVRESAEDLMEKMRSFWQSIGLVGSATPTMRNSSEVFSLKENR